MVPIHVVKLDRSVLTNMPTDERSLLVLCGHVSNELTIFNKIFLASTNSVKEENGNIERLIHSAQSLVLTRDVIGKVVEARLLFTNRVMKNARISSLVRSGLSEQGKAALQKLDLIMNDGVLARIRNSFSFHYSDKENATVQSFSVIPDESDFIAVLSETVGNTLYHFSEQIVQTALLGIVDIQKKEETHEEWLLRTFQIVLDKTILATGYTLTLFMEVMALFSNSYFANQRYQTTAVSSIPIREMKLPFFVEN